MNTFQGIVIDSIRQSVPEVKDELIIRLSNGSAELCKAGINVSTNTKEKSIFFTWEEFLILFGRILDINAAL